MAPEMNIHLVQVTANVQPTAVTKVGTIAGVLRILRAVWRSLFQAGGL